MHVPYSWMCGYWRGRAIALRYTSSSKIRYQSEAAVPQVGKLPHSCYHNHICHAMASEGTPQMADNASRTMKRTYTGMWTGEDLDADYGVVAASAPSGRRAGQPHQQSSLHWLAAGSGDGNV